MRNRTSSFQLNGKLDKPETVILAIERETKCPTPIDLKNLNTLDGEIEEMVTIGKGAQGDVFYIQVIFDTAYGEERRNCVLKRILKKSSLQFEQDPKVSETSDVISLINKNFETSTECNIIKLIASFETGKASYQLYPFCDLVLNKVSEEFKEDRRLLKTSIHLSTVLHVLLDILTALQYLHESGYVHGDVKLENIAFYRGHWCLIDFDSSHRANESMEFHGSIFYSHPACFDKQIGNLAYSNPKNDLYALGIAIKLLLDNIKPSNEQDSTATYRLMKHKEKEYLKAKAQEEHITNLRKNGLEARSPHQLPEFTDSMTVYEKLSLLTDYLTQNLFEKIPDISTVLEQCEQLKDQLTVEYNITEERLEEELNHFYTKIASHSSFSPIPTPNNILSESFCNSSGSSYYPRLSLFSISSLNSSLRKYSGTEPESPQTPEHVKK